MRAIDATVRKNDGLLGVRSFHFFQVYLSHCQGFSGGSAAKESAWHAGDSDSIPVEKIPWRREWLPTLVFLPEEFHGQRSLASCSPWGCKESDTIKWLKLSFSLFSHCWERNTCTIHVHHFLLDRATYQNKSISCITKTSKERKSKAMVK